MKRGRVRLAAPALLAAPTPTAVLMPGAAPGEWELCRTAATVATGAVSPVGGPAGVTRQTFSTLEAAAANLQPAEPFVLALPIEMGLLQRLSLPAAEPSELLEMARIQLEKILPYPADSVGVATQEISRTETDVSLAVETVYHDRLLSLCEPLTSRDNWPLRVVFQAVALTAGAVSKAENAAILYRESGKYVLGICENGRLSFAQALGGQTVDDLAAELPAVLLGAELDGVPTAFSVLRLDGSQGDGSAVVAAALNVPVERFDTAAAALASVSAGRGRDDGDLSPASWRAERQRRERAARVKQRVLLGAVIYVGLLLLGLLALGVTKFQVHRLDSRLNKLRPLAASAQSSATHWKTLSSAVDWHHSLAEILRDICEDCLPPGDTVRLTAFDLTNRGIAVQGEAPSAEAAVEYTEKLRTHPDLKPYNFEADPPTILPNGRARFRVSGNL